MILLWVMLLLHCGYTLVPVTRVQLGESATFTCPLPNSLITREKVHWYKQSAGDTMKLIVTLHKSTKPKYEPEFSESRWEANKDDKLSNLTILKTIQEDEGMYHCEVMEFVSNPVWSGTYFILKGNPQTTSNYTVVQWPTVSDPVHPGDSVTLQCSVLSDSENKTCSGDHSVFWFRAGSDKSHPDIIYTDGNRHDQCDKSQKRCLYHFSKDISSSDNGTYYCAVATCGEILFGNGTKLEIQESKAGYEFTALVIAIICLVISLFGNIVCIYYQFKGLESDASQARHDNSIQLAHDITEGGDDLNYAALHFSRRKATRGGKNTELKTEESVYAQVKCQM